MSHPIALRPVATAGLKYLVLTAGAAVMLLPFVWMILSSFMTSQEIIARPLTWFPADPGLGAYRGLRDAIVDRAAEQGVVVRGECGDDGAHLRCLVKGHRARNFRWQHGAGFRGAKALIGLAAPPWSRR